MLQEDFQQKLDEAFELINNDVELALDIFNDLLGLEPENIELLNGKASALIRLEKFDEAEETINKSLLIDENPTALLNKGVVLKYKKEYQSALKFFNRAVQLNPDLNSIVFIFKKEIIDLIDDSIFTYNSFSENVNEFIKMGIYYRECMNYCDAFDCFNRAITEDPSCNASVMPLVEEVKTLLFNEFMFHTPDFESENVSDLRIEFIRALLIEENPQDALAIIDLNLKRDAEDLNALNFKGCILFLFEKYSQSIDCFDKCLEIDEEYFYALFNKGMVLRIMNKLDEALICFDALLNESGYGDKAEKYKIETLEKIKIID